MNDPRNRPPPSPGADDRGPVPPAPKTPSGPDIPAVIAAPPLAPVRPSGEFSLVGGDMTALGNLHAAAKEKTVELLRRRRDEGWLRIDDAEITVIAGYVGLFVRELITRSPDARAERERRRGQSSDPAALVPTVPARPSLMNTESTEPAANAPSWPSKDPRR